MPIEKTSTILQKATSNLTIGHGVSAQGLTIRLHGRREREESRSEPHRVDWGRTGKHDGEVVGRISVSHRMPCLLPVDHFSLTILQASVANPRREIPA